MPTTPDETGEVFKRPALDLLADINKGKAAAALTDEIHDALTAMADTGRPAVVMVTIKFEPDKKAPDERVYVTAAVTSKLPRLPERPSMFYLNDDNNLTRTDPRQEAFEGMRVIDDLEPKKDARSRAANDR